MLINAFATNHIDYCDVVVVDAAAVYASPLQLVLEKRRYDRIMPVIREERHWLPIPQRVEYKVVRLQVPTSKCNVISRKNVRRTVRNFDTDPPSSAPFLER